MFAKTNRAESQALLASEAAGLDLLARWAPVGLVVPRPLACGVVGDWAVLVLPWLELSTGSGDWAALGRGLANLHRSSCAGNEGKGYGLEIDNFIGSAPQRNRWCPEWTTFFAECRLMPQFERAAMAGHGLQGAQRLLEQLPELLGRHGCEPVLVHGDLWCGNAGLVSGGGTIFDPACYWGDREVDMAMAQLFGGFPSPFFQGYIETWPLPDGARERRDIYNLYHLINHANLFGGNYAQQAQVVMNKLLDCPP